MLQHNIICAFAQGWWPHTPQGRGASAPTRELALQGAHKIPPVTRPWCAPLSPEFKCPVTHSSSTDGLELSEERANRTAKQPLPEAEPAQPTEPTAEAPTGVDSEPGSTSSDSEPSDSEAEPPPTECAHVFLQNIKSGKFHALLPCEPSDKNAIPVVDGSNTYWYCTPCGKQPAHQEVLFKRPQFMEPCGPSLCRRFLG